MGSRELSSVTYKKGNWVRYSLWGIATLCIGILIFMFVLTLNNEISATAPNGYKFSISDNYDKDNNTYTTYYIYDDHILVEKRQPKDDNSKPIGIIYDNINTSSLIKEYDDSLNNCGTDDCYPSSKILTAIKKLISNKPGREYIGF